MNEKYPLAKKGAENLRANRIWLARAEGMTTEQTGFYPPETDHNPPSQGHYTAAYDWDEAAADYISATAGLQDGPDSLYYTRAAKRGLRVLTEGIDENGFLPNYRYLGKPRRFDPEMMLAFKRGATESNYTQPPLLALSALQTYRASVKHSDNSEEFLAEIYDPLSRHYNYFDQRLKNKKNGLNDLYQPHMTGRDSDPTFDDLKPLRIPRRGPDTLKIIDKLNIAIDYGSILWHGARLRMAGDSEEEWLKVYSMNDVMMNCIVADNLNDMAALANLNHMPEDAEMFTSRARKLGRAIMDKMWFPDARDGRGGFYGLDKHGEPINEVSISNLFPLTLDNLPEHQLESLLGMMDVSFNTPFPLPSVATDSRNYDPHNHESWRLWRGPKWMITDWYIVERGLRRQAERLDLKRPDLIDRCNQWANKIAKKSIEVVEAHGPREHYNPITGEGQRNAVVNFGWSNLAYLMQIDR